MDSCTSQDDDNSDKMTPFILAPRIMDMTIHVLPKMMTILMMNHFLIKIQTMLMTILMMTQVILNVMMIQQMMFCFSM
jgi:hypothetical protein